MTTPNPPDMLGYAARVDAATMSPRRRALRWLKTWSLAGMAAFWWVVIAAAVPAFLTRNPFAAVASVVFAIVLIVFVGVCLRSLRALRARRVLAYVEQAVRLGVPMPDFLRAAAAAERPPVSRHLVALAGSLAASTRLGDALRSEVPELPLRATGIIRVASDNGTLPAALARLVAEHEPTAEQAFRRRFPWLYLAVLLLTLPPIVGLLAIFVLPKFAEIMRDFGIPAPAWFGWVGSLHDGQSAAAVGLGTLAAFAILLLMLVRSFRWVLFRRRDLERPFAFAHDRIAWSLPLVGGVVRDRNYGDVCQAVADGLAAFRPADVAVGEAALLNLNEVLVDRVRAWRAALAAGHPLGRAARVAGMPGLIADLAGDAGAPTHAADAFAFLARHYRGRADRTREWLVAFTTPALAIVAGLCVGTIAYGLFDAIQRLIWSAMPHNLGM